jgi:hypothetical protein
LFLVAKRFGQNIYPIGIAIHLNNLYVTEVDLILEMVPFDGDAIGSYLRVGALV